MNTRGNSMTCLMGAVLFALTACGAETPSMRTQIDDGTNMVDPITGLPTNPTPGQGGTTAGDGTMTPVGMGTGGTGGITTPADGTPVPCDVQNVVANNCGTCHGAAPIGGAVRLMTYEDFHKPSPNYGPVKLMDTTKQIYQVAQIRINNGEMPQNKAMAPADLTMLDTWLGAGALAGTAADAACEIVKAPVDPGPTGPQNEVYCDRPGGRDPLVARAGETCYDFLTHGATGAADTSPFQIGLNESYAELHYAIPWKDGDTMTRFGADFDNLPVLHHYLFFHSHAPTAPGTVTKNVSGTTIGTDARLLAGWAIGGCGQEYPAEVGMWLPAPTDGHIMIQWHHFNTTGAAQPDNSVVQICTVPAGTRPNIGDVTFLGTENFNSIAGMPPGPNSFTTNCTNNSGKEATIVGWMPHMHLLGVNMKTTLKHADGSMDPFVFDKPFKFDYQIGYAQDPPLKVGAGDTLTTTCSFVNTTGANVAFGQSTKAEMCYQFASYYPIGALVNGTPSLIGAKNTCW